MREIDLGGTIEEAPRSEAPHSVVAGGRACPHISTPRPSPGGAPKARRRAAGAERRCGGLPDMQPGGDARDIMRRGQGDGRGRSRAFARRKPLPGTAAPDAFAAQPERPAPPGAEAARAVDRAAGGGARAAAKVGLPRAARARPATRPRRVNP